MRNETATLISVDPRTLGSDLVADAAQGATQLLVDDTLDFDDTGGQLQVNDAVLTYSTFDDLTATITLTDPLPAAAAVGDRVDVYDTDQQEAAVEWLGQVQVDGEEFNGETLTADIRQSLLPYLDEGLQPPDRQVIVQWDDEDDALTVIDFANRGQRDGSTLFCNTDTFAIADGGEQSLTLTHEPIEGSEHFYLNGVQYDAADGWSRSGNTISLLAAIDARAGDVVTIEYAYQGRTIDGTIVAFGSPGWRYLQLVNTDTTDYSSPSFDDSAWSVGVAAFGYRGPTADPLAPGIEPIRTLWDQNTRLWLRRTFPAASGVSGTVRIEDNAHVYVNGNLVIATPVVGSGGNEPGVDFTVPSGFLTTDGSDNVLAVRCDDEYQGTYSSNAVYADVELRGQLK